LSLNHNNHTIELQSFIFQAASSQKSSAASWENLQCPDFCQLPKCCTGSSRYQPRGSDDLSFTHDRSYRSRPCSHASFTPSIQNTHLIPLSLDHLSSCPPWSTISDNAQA
jgi:hypothetical protein